MRGRKPTPTALKVIRGNPGKRPLPENEPEPEAGAGAPEWLTPAALAHWPTVAAQLEAANVLTQMDAVALGLYCESFARWKDANALVERHGLVIQGQRGTLVTSPYVSIAAKAFDQMTKLLVEFGMTPSSRARVGAAKPKEKANPFADLIKAKR